MEEVRELLVRSQVGRHTTKLPQVSLNTGFQSVAKYERRMDGKMVNEVVRELTR